MKEKQKYILAVDLGATSGRMILACLKDGQLEMKEWRRFPNNIIEIQGKYYWNIAALFEEIREGLNACVEADIDVQSIGIDSWGVDVAFIDAQGHIIANPRAYRDPYTMNVMPEFFKKMSKEEIYQKTGVQFLNFNTLFQLYACQKEQYKPFQEAATILFIPDLFSYLLTGNKICEYTILSTSQFLNPNTQTIDNQLLNIVGADVSRFPEMVMPGTVIGNMNPELLTQPFKDVVQVVAVAGHDTASAVAAVPAKDKHFAYLSSGTWSLMGIEIAEPIISEQSAAWNFTNEGGIEGTTRFLKNITGLWIYEQCKKEWASEGYEYTHQELQEMMVESEAFRTIINPDDSAFANPTSMITAIETYCRHHHLNLPQTHAQFVRTIFESLAMRYRVVFNALKNMAPFAIDCLHIIGGGSMNDTLNQMTANAIGIPVSAGPAEATAIGNIMMQLKACGLIKDVTQMRHLIADSISIKSYHPQNIELWNEAYLKYQAQYL